MAVAQRIRSLFADPVLVLTVFALAAFGAAMIYSAGQLEVPDPAATSAWRQQVIWLGMSLVALFTVMRLPVRWLEWCAAPAYSTGLAARAGTLVIGTGGGTAASMKGWIRLG